MFTGIITDIGRIVAVEETNWGRRFRIATPGETGTLQIGASIACSGPCLTVTRKGETGGERWFEVDATSETLACTTARDWTAGSTVNLERPLRAGDELGGHVVSGHVDGVARVAARKDAGETTRFDLDAPSGLARFIAPKGSVCLDGVSLTVNAVGTGETDNRFSVMIIPHTLAATTLSGWQAGTAVNLEVDVFARYLDRLRPGG